MADIDVRPAEAYARNAPDERPLRGYAAVMAVFTAAVATAAGVAKLTGRRLPDRPSGADLALLAVSTHKLSRLITKDAVTSPIRAPFTRFESAAGSGELQEHTRGHGVQHAIGELLTCPFCTAVWVASGLGAGLVFAPRATRYAMGIASAVAAADFLHLAYDAAKKAAR